MTDCQRHTGTQCEVQITGRNGCLAMAAGDTHMNTKGAPTKYEAERIALSTCSSVDKNCRIYYSGCSFADLVP